MESSGKEKRNLSSQATLAFIEKHAPFLKECSCNPLLNRGHGGENARDFVDSLAVKTFNDKKWPKEHPIQLLDVSAGLLLQAATVVTSLVNAGYKVEISIADMNYQGWDDKIKKGKTAEQKDHSKAVYEFINLLKALNAENPGRGDVAVLNGVFTHVDSYLATAKGKEPLAYQRVPSNKELKEKLAEGCKRRYINLDLRTTEEKTKNESNLLSFETERNMAFAEEFEQVAKCQQKYPDLVLLVDDISNFVPVWLNYESKKGEPSGVKVYEDLSTDYAYRNEVVDPITEKNPNAVYIATQKQLVQNIDPISHQRPKGDVSVHVIEGKVETIYTLQGDTFRDIKTGQTSMITNKPEEEKIKNVEEEKHSFIAKNKENLEEEKNVKKMNKADTPIFYKPNFFEDCLTAYINENEHSEAKRSTFFNSFIRIFSDPVNKQIKYAKLYLDLLKNNDGSEIGNKHIMMYALLSNTSIPDLTQWVARAMGCMSIDGKDRARIEEYFALRELVETDKNIITKADFERMAMQINKEIDSIAAKLNPDSGKMKETINRIINRVNMNNPKV